MVLLNSILLLPWDFLPPSTFGFFSARGRCAAIWLLFLDLDNVCKRCGSVNTACEKCLERATQRPFFFRAIYPDIPRKQRIARERGERAFYFNSIPSSFQKKYTLIGFRSCNLFSFISKNKLQENEYLGSNFKNAPRFFPVPRDLPLFAF